MTRTSQDNDRGIPSGHIVGHFIVALALVVSSARSGLAQWQAIDPPPVFGGTVEALAPTADGSLVAFAGRRILKLDAATSTWTESSVPADCMQSSIRKLILQPNGTLFGMTGFCLLRSLDDGATWESPEPPPSLAHWYSECDGSGRCDGIHDVFADEEGAVYVYGNWGGEPSTHKTVDLGASWTTTDRMPQAATSSNTLFSFGDVGTYQRSVNGGETWQDTNVGSEGLFVDSSDRVYVIQTEGDDADNRVMVRSDDEGVTWSKVVTFADWFEQATEEMPWWRRCHFARSWTRNYPRGATHRSDRVVVVCPVEPASARVSYSDDGAQTWNTLELSYQGPTLPATSNVWEWGTWPILTLGTSLVAAVQGDGIYIHRLGSDNWERFDDGLIREPIHFVPSRSGMAEVYGGYAFDEDTRSWIKVETGSGLPDGWLEGPGGNLYKQIGGVVLKRTPGANDSTVVFAHIGRLFFTIGQDDNLYALTREGEGPAFLHKSSDQGASWESSLLVSLPSGFIPSFLSVSQYGTIFLGGEDHCCDVIAASRDGGASWSTRQGYEYYRTLGLLGLRADVPDLVYVWSGNGNLTWSGDDGRTWFQNSFYFHDEFRVAIDSLGFFLRWDRDGVRVRHFSEPELYEDRNEVYPSPPHRIVWEPEDYSISPVWPLPQEYFTFSNSGAGFAVTEAGLFYHPFSLLLTPADGAANLSRTTELAWRWSPGKKRYDLQVSSDGDFKNIVHHENTPDLNTTFVAPLSSSDYYWRVRAVVNGMPGEWSDARHFAVGEEGTLITELASPPDGASDQTRELDISWHASPGADSYQLQLARDVDISDLVASEASISDTTYHVSGLEIGTTYYWRVRSSNSSGNGPWSDVWSFGTEIPPVQLFLPENGATGVSPEVTLLWRSVPDQSHVGYHLQIAADSILHDLVIDDTLFVRSSMTYRLANKTSFYWRVRVGKDEGARGYVPVFGPWSETWKFETAVGTSAEPQLSLPTAFALHPAYPNPFNPSTTIRYDLPEVATVRLTVFDGLGRRIEELGTWNLEPGTHTVTWDASTHPSGMYFVRMEAGSFSSTRQLILLK